MMDCPHCGEPIQAFALAEPLMIGSSGTHSWFDTLPEELDIGKKVKYVPDYEADWLTSKYKECTVIQHYINHDDCSGMHGKESYCVKNEEGERFSSTVDSFEEL